MSTVQPINIDEQGQEIKSELESILNLQKRDFQKQGFPDAELRIDRLDRCIRLLVDNQDEICEAITKDFGCRSLAVTKGAELLTAINYFKRCKKLVRKWMKPEKRRADFPFNMLGAKAYLYFQPLGVIGIVTPWNAPIGVGFMCVADAITAGNRFMIKQSEYGPVFGELCAELIAKYFDKTEGHVINGGPDVAIAFTKLPFDHLIFTGGTEIAKHVMRAASENLVPVTLELGGKSPAIIGSDVNLDEAVETVMYGKTVNGGQVCMSPDYALVQNDQMDKFIAAAEKTVTKFYPTMKDNPDYTSIIDNRQYDRILGLITEAEERGCKVIRVNPGNEDLPNKDLRKIPLTLIVDPPDDLKVMQEEIFGPVLPIKSYDKFDETIDFINSKGRPLALYLFGTNENEKTKVLNNTTAGGVSVNGMMMHAMMTELPFGGVGTSGMGQYAGGYEGFRTFSNQKAVFEQGWYAGITDFFKPPHSDKFWKFLNKQLSK